MPNKMRIGPEVKIKLSCFGCEHCKTTRYTNQGDSGCDVFCSAMEMGRIGDTIWITPDWCPYRESALRSKLSAVLDSLSAANSVDGRNDEEAK